MGIETLALDEDKIGEVFTPAKWADWLLKRGDVFDRWIEGATVCDPTAGTGVFARALIRAAIEKGIKVTPPMLERLHLIELKKKTLNIFKEIVRVEFGIDYPVDSIHYGDVILDRFDTKYDILVGNPPWANFAALPEAYKEKLKPKFIEYGLVPDRKAVLLGSSRTDLAALVIKIVISEFLNSGGDGYFFLPLSLFSGDDAHIGFRDYRAGEAYFSAEEVYEFSKTKVFEGVGTSYCYAKFRRDKKQDFPVSYFREDSYGWRELKASPLKSQSDQWRVIEPSDENTSMLSIDVQLSKRQKPRQGVNTCGANSILIFDSFPDFIDPNYVFPLATKELWREADAVPRKWVFLPYDTLSGKPLSPDVIEAVNGYGYLKKHEDALRLRKGTLINSAIGKGLWWAMLGVGPYSFAPYKVIWEAYGNKNFDPIVLGSFDDSPWQANQAMQAFIPCETYEEAEKICSDLKNPSIARLLKELNGDGKCNFAQPGKIKKILSFDREVTEQLTLLEEKNNYRTNRIIQSAVVLD